MSFYNNILVVGKASVIYICVYFIVINCVVHIYGPNHILVMGATVQLKFSNGKRERGGGGEIYVGTLLIVHIYLFLLTYIYSSSNKDLSIVCWTELRPDSNNMPI